MDHYIWLSNRNIEHYPLVQNSVAEFKGSDQKTKE